MATEGPGHFAETEPDRKLRSVFSAAVQKGMAGVHLQAELSHHSTGAILVVHVDKYRSIDVGFEVVPGDVVFVRAGARIIAVGSLWDDDVVEEKLAAIIKKIVAQKFSQMRAA